jgi:hypothetical protein
MIVDHLVNDLEIILVDDLEIILVDDLDEYIATTNWRRLRGS